MTWGWDDMGNVPVLYSIEQLRQCSSLANQACGFTIICWIVDALSVPHDVCEAVGRSSLTCVELYSCTEPVVTSLLSLTAETSTTHALVPFSVTAA